MEFSEDIVKLLKDRYPDKDIYNMSLEELKDFKEEIENLRHEYSLLELANKLSGNGAYGAAAAAQFYFYNVSLAGDITGECKILTKTMWQKLEHFFHETFGKRLTKTRAQEKAFIAANEFYCKVGDFIHKFVLKDFENLINGTEKAFWKCVDHKNNLINEKFHLNN